jgi:hypothetical protein
MKQCSNQSQETAVEDCGTEKDISEKDKIEYQEALKLWQDDSRLRRQGLAFVATFQGILISVLSNPSEDNPIIFISLAALAMFVALLGLNNDRRLSRYMGAYATRLIEIEKKNNLSLVRIILDVAKNRTPLLTNEMVFGTFFVLIGIGWGVCIIWKFWTL